jgi:hypothetical protein
LRVRRSSQHCGHAERVVAIGLPGGEKLEDSGRSGRVRTGFQRARHRFGDGLRSEDVVADAAEHQASDALRQAQGDLEHQLRPKGEADGIERLRRQLAHH